MKKIVLFIVLLIGMISVQISYGQSVTITPANDTICEGSGTTVTLTANPSGGLVIGYLWSTGATSSTINVSPLVTTTYSVTATFTSGTASASAEVVVLPQPAQGTITVVGPDTVCTGNMVQLDASAGDSWQWYHNGNPISGATSQTHFADATGDYTVLVTTGGCNAPMSAATTATIIPPPVANVTPTGPLSECYGSTILLTADAVSGATYQWWYSPDGLSGTWSTVVGANNQTYDASISGFFGVQVILGACEARSFTP